MEIKLFEKAERDLKFWQKSGNKVIQVKIQQLFKEILAHPFEGVGKPEALRHELSGQWSRRINQEHRIIYEVINDVLYVYSLRGHY